MRTVKYFLMAVLAMGLVAGLGMFQAAYQDKPKYTIEEIMEKGHDGKEKSLLNQVAGGKASKEQKKQLLELYQELAKNKPPKGDAGSWKKRTTALIAAAKDVNADKPGSGPALRKAAACKACHSVHKDD